MYQKWLIGLLLVIYVDSQESEPTKCEHLLVYVNIVNELVVSNKYLRIKSSDIWIVLSNKFHTYILRCKIEN